MLDPTPTEREAVMLRWRAEHPDAISGTGPSDDEAEALLLDIRQRAMQIENASLGMLMKNMRVRPSGNNAPSLRPFFFALSVILGIVVLVFVANFIFSR